MVMCRIKELWEGKTTSKLLKLSPVLKASCMERYSTLMTFIISSTDWQHHVYPKLCFTLITWTCCHSNSRYCVNPGTWQRSSINNGSCDWWKVNLHGLYSRSACNWCGFIWIWNPRKQSNFVGLSRSQCSLLVSKWAKPIKVVHG